MTRLKYANDNLPAFEFFCDGAWFFQARCTFEEAYKMAHDHNLSYKLLREKDIAEEGKM